jgi:type III secretion system low calcium response chaperone LcrH/SycD
MDRKEQEIYSEMQKLGNTHAEEIDQSLETVSNNIFKGGLTPQEALNIPNKKMEALYAQGYHLFNTGNYVKAGKIFGLLCIMAQTDPRFFMANAASLHKQKRYQDAMKNYGMASSYDPLNPIPLYHSVDCALELGDRMSASVLLEMVIERCEDKEEFSLVKERCTVLRDLLIKDINERGAFPKKGE